MQQYPYSAYNPYAGPAGASFGPPPPGMLAPHHAHHPMSQPFMGSPAPQGTVSSHPAAASPAWTKQLELASLSRASSGLFHHAKTAQILQRGHNTAALAIVDPKDKDTPASAAKQKTPANGQTGSKADRPGTLEHTDSNVVPKKLSGQQEGNSQDAWSALDMGGVGFKSLSPALFTYTFLTSLYLGHNQLTFIPPGLASLKALVRLDLSSNKITAVPPELGVLTNLKDLLLFDNQIMTLPHELGTLSGLEMLGLEGNPLSESLRSIMEKDGTTKLIHYLRDNCPIPGAPPDREWVQLMTDDPDDQAEDSFTVLCYNVLSEKAATEAAYGYTPSWALSWEYRKEQVLNHILLHMPEVVALQEVDSDQYQEYFLHNLSQHDYSGVFWPRSRARTSSDEERKKIDGCAIFYSASQFSLIEGQSIEFSSLALRRPDLQKSEAMFNRVQGRDHVASVALLEHKTTAARIIVANAHIFWNPEYRDVKLVQSALLIEELAKIVDRFGKLSPRLDAPDAPRYSKDNKVPVVLCGDFNSEPTSGVYEYLSSGSLSPDHEDFMGFKYGSLTTEGLRHSLNLKSSYGEIGELPLTNHTPGFSGVIDYIWYSADSLQVTAVMGEVDKDYLSRTVGFPNAHFPSDHIYIAAVFKHKRPVSNGV